MYLSSPQSVIALCLFGIFCTPAWSQVLGTQEEPLIITSTKTAQSPERIGSSVSVITSEEIARTGSANLVDILQSVPGLTIRTNGGMGSVTQPSLRGSEVGQTLVLLDGIRLGDPSTPDGASDLGNLALVNIDRIEIIRGPQSALWGSAAMGGVINIITKKGKGEPHANASFEGGSYGLAHEQASFSGGDQKFDYALALDALHSDNFPRYGYRIPADRNLNLPPLPKADPTDRIGGNLRMAYRPTDHWQIETGLFASDNRARIDNPGAGAYTYDPYNRSLARFVQGWVKNTMDLLEGQLKLTSSLFGDRTERETYSKSSWGAYMYPFTGMKKGMEQQADVKLGVFGLLTLGTRWEEESAQNDDWKYQTTRSLFVQHQINIGNRLDLSIGGRLDSIAHGNQFYTWRGTAAYRWDETGTKLRASVGTGGKEPSLYQKYGSDIGNLNLKPEYNMGMDIGIDQKFWNDRLLVSATYFHMTYKDLIGYNNSNTPPCTSTQNWGCYYNVGRALTRGVELSANVTLFPHILRAKTSFTRLDAQDLETHQLLPLRPQAQSSLSLIYTGITDLEVEGRLTYVGNRRDSSSHSLSPYKKIDAYATYKLSPHVSIYLRGENLTNIHYEEVYNYGTAGLSLYGGIRTSW